MKNIRLIAIDLDGTLLRDDISVSDYTKRVLSKVREKGVHIVIATGRMFCSAREWGKAIGIGDVPLCAYTGSMVGLCESGKIISDQRMDLNVARDILNEGKENNWYMQSYIDDKVYVPFRDERTDHYERICNIRAHVVGNDFWTPEKAPTKVLFYDNDLSVMEKIRKLVGKKFEKVAGSVISQPNYFEFNKKGVSKGNAITKLCNERNIPLDSVMTFGNAQNDISMFELSPWSFAVENASEVAKASAKFTTLSNNQDGVAHAIEKYVLEA